MRLRKLGKSKNCEEDRFQWSPKKTQKHSESKDNQTELTNHRMPYY